MYKIRELEQILVDSVEKRFISILLGARQTGKTSILKRLERVITCKSIFLDLDIFENKGIFSSYTEVINYLKFNGYKENERFVLYLDEFHTVKGIDKILKNLYDNNPNLKIFATGSSSLEIIKYLKQSLAGRKSIFHLYPLSFKEFIYFKDEQLYAKLNKAGFKQLPEIITDKLNDYVKEFCVFGGYPEVVLTGKESDKKDVLRNIFDLFVKKDLLEFLNIKNPVAALNILKYLSLNIGGILNYTDLCSVNSVDVNTLKKYINILAQTFIIKPVQPFFTNKKKEIIKAPKIYFHDPGARNYFIKDFTWFDSRRDNSFLAENFVLAEFIKKKGYYTAIKYWRDKNGREIDFILEQDSKLYAYEIKYKHRIKNRDLSNLRYFKGIYKESTINLVNIEKPDIDIQGLNLLSYFEVQVEEVKG